MSWRLRGMNYTSQVQRWMLIDEHIFPAKDFRKRFCKRIKKFKKTPIWIDNIKSKRYLIKSSLELDPDRKKFCFDELINKFHEFSIRNLRFLFVKLNLMNFKSCSLFGFTNSESLIFMIASKILTQNTTKTEQFLRISH